MRNYLYFLQQQKARRMRDLLGRKVPRCPVRKPGETYQCTLRRDHDGDHRAYVPTSETASEPRTWPRRRPSGPRVKP